VDIQVESVPGLKMKGAMERIAPQALIKNGIKGFSARVVIKNIDPRVRPGMTAVLNIPVSSADNVLAVPLAAVFSESNERFVFVKNEDHFDRRPVIIGITDYSHAEVVKGLASGEVVSLDQTLNTSGIKAPPSASGSASPKKRSNRSDTTAGTGGASSPAGSAGAAAAGTESGSRTPAAGAAPAPAPTPTPSTPTPAASASRPSGS
jgi:HlyD family secretion protein